MSDSKKARNHVSHVVERDAQPGRLPKYRSTLIVVRDGKVTKEQSEWLAGDQFTTTLATHRRRAGDALLRWLGPGGGR